MKAAFGLALVAAHAAAFAVLAERCHGTELVVDVPAPLASEQLALAGTVPAAIAARVTNTLEQGAPGLARRTWSIAYRGGHARTVGAAQLVGPFQDPARPACSGRVVVGQRLLDDGTAGPHTVAGQMKRALEAELRGEGAVGIGDFVRVDKLALAWAELAAHPEDARLVKAAPHGYVRLTAQLVFDRVRIPLTVALLPKISARSLAFDIRARAELDFGNRVIQWISDKLGGDAFATRLARREIDNGLVTALAPPPPFDLGDGRTLTFAYCDGAPAIVENTSGALPFAVAIGRVDGAPTVLPPRRGPAPVLPLAPSAAFAIDLDLDALNALLFELWRTGFLDERLAAAGLDRRFNADPTVTEFLSLRISAPRLALPPVLAPHGDHLRLAADARVAIADGAHTTVGRVWGGLDFRLGAGVEPVAVDLGALELACERTATRLAPCYADLVAAIRDRGAEFHGELSRTFAGLLADIFVERRLSAPGFPAELVIRSASPRVVTGASNASLHLDLAATLVAR